MIYRVFCIVLPLIRSARGNQRRLCPGPQGGRKADLGSEILKFSKLRAGPGVSLGVSTIMPGGLDPTRHEQVIAMRREDRFQAFQSFQDRCEHPQ